MTKITQSTATIVLDPSDESEIDSVTLILQGPGAAEFAKTSLQSTLGSTWEADGPDFAYCMVINEEGLPDAVRKETGCRVDDAQWSPPETGEGYTSTEFSLDE